MSRAAPLLFARAALACSATGSRTAPQARLATDLPAPFVDTALQIVARAGGPQVERSPASSAAADVFWGAEPYAAGSWAAAVVSGAAAPSAAVAAATRGEFAPLPQSASDVPPLFRDPTGTW